MDGKVSVGLSVFGESELTDVGIAISEQVGATGEVFEVAVVDLLGLDGQGLVSPRLQRGRP